MQTSFASRAFEFLKRFGVSSFVLANMHICQTDQEKGVDLATKLLNFLSGRKTALFLSGGKTPIGLYQKLARDGQLAAGAVGMVDERFGSKWHLQSNETMLRDTNLLRYFSLLNIPFYPILGPGKTKEEAAELYDEKVRALYASFPQSIGLLGVGRDGHTAGLPVKTGLENVFADKSSLVVSYDDRAVMGERVTMTFLALSMLDFLLVLVFGKDKQKALQDMLNDGPEEQVPARFFKRPEIGKKTLFITDQILK